MAKIAVKPSNIKYIDKKTDDIPLTRNRREYTFLILW